MEVTRLSDQEKNTNIPCVQNILINFKSMLKKIGSTNIHIFNKNKENKHADFIIVIQNDHPCWQASKRETIFSIPD